MTILRAIDGNGHTPDVAEDNPAMALGFALRAELNAISVQLGLILAGITGLVQQIDEEQPK